jgi:hypothetical protein
VTRRRSLLPDPRVSLLRLTISQTSLSSSIDSDTKLPGFLKFITTCSNLLSLTLHVPALNDDDLWILSRQCPSLQRLTLVSVPHLSWARVSDEGVAAICKQAKELRHLHIKVQEEQVREGRPVDGERRMRNARDEESASGWVISERYLYKAFPLLQIQYLNVLKWITGAC